MYVLLWKRVIVVAMLVLITVFWLRALATPFGVGLSPLSSLHSIGMRHIATQVVVAHNDFFRPNFIDEVGRGHEQHSIALDMQLKSHDLVRTHLGSNDTNVHQQRASRSHNHSGRQIIHPLPNWAGNQPLCTQLDRIITSAPSQHQLSLRRLAQQARLLRLYIYSPAPKIPWSAASLIARYPKCKSFQWSGDWEMLDRLQRDGRRELDGNAADFYVVPFLSKCYFNHIAKYRLEAMDEALRQERRPSDPRSPAPVAL